jgi:hypothetical protein
VPQRTSISLFALLAASCLSTKPVAVNGNAENLGSINVSAPRLGDLTVIPTDCVSGARQYFLGGDFTDEKTGVVVRLVVDPISGPAIKIFSADAPFEKSVVFRRDDCSVFHFSLESTGWRVNRIDDYRMTLNVDCSRTGELVRGTASATHCH